MQEFKEQSFSVQDLKAGRFDEFNFWVKDNDVSPRFTLTVLDNLYDERSTQLCTLTRYHFVSNIVFIIYNLVVGFVLSSYCPWVESQNINFQRLKG